MPSVSRNLIKKLSRALKEKIQGDFNFDSHSRLQYSTAACMYRIFPMGVVCPRDGDDVSTVIGIARDFNIPVTARGAGVGRTGSALGSGLILDFSRYMNRILSIDSERKKVRLEPGVVQHDLNRALSGYNLFFPPDPSSNRYCTVGGMIGNNAAGAHSLKYGATKDHILSVSAVMSDGSEALFTRNMVPGDCPGDRLNGLVRGMDDILTRYRQDLDLHLPRTSKNSSGYLIRDAAPGNGSIDLATMLAASEGTLALFTEIELQVTPKPLHTGLMLLFCESLEAAGEVVIVARDHEPSMLEIMEHTFINLVRKSAFEVGIPLPRNLKVMLLVEFDGDSREEILDRMSRLESELIGPGCPVLSVRKGVEPEENVRLTRIRNAASPILNRIPPPLYPARFIEDGTVPVENLPAYIHGLHHILDRHGLTGVIFGHAGNGNIHVNPFMDITRPDFREQMERIARDTARLIKSLNGSLSGEHGDGLIRSPMLPEMFESAYCAFEDVKRLFDPDGILNPGIIVGGKRFRLSDNLKVFDLARSGNFLNPLCEPKVLENLAHCSGCGACRAYCPVFRATGDEMATPRAKANLISWLITNSAVETMGGVGPEEKALLDTCIACGTCLNECPSGVNIPYIVQTAKWVHREDWGTPVADRIVTSSGRMGKIGSVQPQLANRLLGNRLARKVLEKTAGIDMRRGLPEFHQRTSNPIDNAAGSTAGSQPIAYFPGCFADFQDPSGEFEPIRDILSVHDIHPLIPNTRCCGIAGLSAGLRNGVLKDAQFNVDILHDLVLRGYTIVSGAPSCQMAIRHEYPLLLETAESRKVADNMIDIHELLIRFLTRGNLDLNFHTLHHRIAVHQPCHARALSIGELPLKLLRLIPGLVIHPLAPECCGIAGTFGMRRDHFDLSMRIGRPLFIEIKRFQPDFIVTPCGTCRMQFQQATSIPAIHPAALIAQAYGFPLAARGLNLHAARSSS
ncbi:FAD-binding protein [bacterium]|nr:FAD-binding protein [candidate division CSSED10-310 bacterium]